MKKVQIKKLESQIVRVLGEALSQSKNEKFQFISVTEVDLTSDYSFVTIFVTDLNSSSEIVEELNKNKKYFRSFLGRLSMRKIPEPIFKWDSSIEYANKIEKIIKDL